MQRASFSIVSTQWVESSARHGALKMKLEELKDLFEYSMVELGEVQAVFAMNERELDESKVQNCKLKEQVEELNSKIAPLESTNKYLFNRLEFLEHQDGTKESEEQLKTQMHRSSLVIA